MWVTSKGPLRHVDLWVENFDLLDFVTTSYRWIKVPSPVEVPGNERADALAEMGRKSCPLNVTKWVQVQRIGTPIVVSPPDRLRSPLVDSLSIVWTSVELMPMVPPPPQCQWTPPCQWNPPFQRRNMAPLPNGPPLSKEESRPLPRTFHQIAHELPFCA